MHWRREIVRKVCDFSMQISVWSRGEEWGYCVGSFSNVICSVSRGCLILIARYCVEWLWYCSLLSSISKSYITISAHHRLTNVRPRFHHIPSHLSGPMLAWLLPQYNILVPCPPRSDHHGFNHNSHHDGQGHCRSAISVTFVADTMFNGPSCHETVTREGEVRAHR